MKKDFLTENGKGDEYDAMQLKFWNIFNFQQAINLV